MPSKGVCLADYTRPKSPPGEDTLHLESRDGAGPWAPNKAALLLADGRKPLSEEAALKQMMTFFEEYYADDKNSCPIEERDARIAEVLVSIEMTGDYLHTSDELTWAAKTAWRNAARCVGRDLWKSLVVADERNAFTCQDVFDGICRNLRIAFNGGKIIPSATIFRQRFRKDQSTPGIRLWNGVLLGFAGFKMENGDVIGDPKNISLTNIAVRMGWKPRCNNFELLPLIITDVYQKTKLFELPEDIKDFTVDIIHPEIPEITNMGLKWYAIPSVSSMMLEAGGIQYTCSQIAGFFQDTEISVMNILGPPRYNLMEPIGRLLKLDVSKNTSYWKCDVATEVTKAVYHSFTVSRVSIIDHLTMAENFCSFMKEEMKSRGGCPSDWVWVVPPMSGGIVPTFYTEMLRYSLSPSFEYQSGPEIYLRPPRRHITFKTLVRSITIFLGIMSDQRKERRQISLIYATEGGTALRYAKFADTLFTKAFNVTIVPINEIAHPDDFKMFMKTSDVVIFVASTFGEGSAPAIGQCFSKNITEGLYSLDGTSYAVFGLGSSQYIETFAMFGKLLDAELEKIGGKRLTEPGFGDDQSNQKQAFEVWIIALFRKCCNIFFEENGPMFNPNLLRKSFFEPQYRWRYTNEKSLHQSMREKVGLSHQVVEFTLVRRVNLSACGYLDKYFMIVLSYPKQSQSCCNLFSPGQTIGIFPQNLPLAKDTILKSLGNVPFHEIPLKLEKKKDYHELWGEIDSYHSGLNLEQILINIVDLNHVDANSINSDMREDSHGKIQDCDGRRLSLLDDQWNSLDMDCDTFVGESRTISRRLYSIASCPNNQNTVNILVALHEFKDSHNDVIKQGLATNFLRHAPLGEIFYGYFAEREGQLFLPEDHHVPLLLVSAGSGFGPFMSFIESRQLAARSGIKTGNIYIFHGCRCKEWDFLDKLLKNASRDLRIITFRAYSQPNHADDLKIPFLNLGKHPPTNLIKKGYVQDLLKDKCKLILQAIIREKGFMYVCGATNVVNGVRKETRRILEEYVTLEELLKNKRYQEENISDNM